MDKSKMPVCKHGKICKIKNCPLKHVDEEEKPECIAFRQGFCMDGPNCKYRHIKRPPDECPKKANFDQFISASSNQNNYLGKKRKTQQPNQFYKITLCKHWLEHGTCPYAEECHYAHGEEELRAYPGTEDLEDSEVLDIARNKMSNPLVLPFANIGIANVSYYLCHSPDLRALSISKRRSVWSISTRLMNEFNTAYRTSEFVYLFFICRFHKGIYGMARMTGPISPPPPAPLDKPQLLTPEFSVTWIKSLRMSLKLITQLRMSAGFGTSVCRTLTDGRIDKSAGYEMLLIALRKPEWDWTKLPKLVNALPPPTGAGQPPPPPLPPDVLFPPDWGVSREVPVQAVVPGKLPMVTQQPDFYGGDVSGFLLPCPSSLLNESVMSGLVSIPPDLQDLVAHQFVPGALVFLFVIPGPPPHSSDPLLYGLFEGRSGMERDPRPGLSHLGVVRVGLVLEAPPLRGSDVEMVSTYPPPLHLPPPGRLSLVHTKHLCNVLAARVGALPPTLTTAPEPVGNLRPMVGGGATAMQGGAMAMGMFRPRFKHSDTVPVDIPFAGDGFQLRRKLLGSQAALVMQIVNSLASPQTLQIRLRGIGSGFKEGPLQLELNEPLHFVVSADDDSILRAALVKVREHVVGVKLSAMLDI